MSIYHHLVLSNKSIFTHLSIQIGVMACFLVKSQYREVFYLLSVTVFMVKERFVKPTGAKIMFFGEIIANQKCISKKYPLSTII